MGKGVITWACILFALFLSTSFDRRLSLVDAQDATVYKCPTYAAPDGTYYPHLDQLRRDSSDPYGPIVVEEIESFYVNVCDFALGSSKCTKPATVCKYRSMTWVSYGLPEPLVIDGGEKTADGSYSPVRMTYVGGMADNYCPSGRISHVLLVCDPSIASTDATVTEATKQSLCEYTFTIPGAGACPGSKGGTGLVIMLTLIGIGVGYMLVGTIYNMKKNDEGFKESIPHREFWIDLPSLVADGCRFTWGKITGRGEESSPLMR